MNNLSSRSLQKELLDSDNIPFEDIRQNMQELNTINNFLGGHAITIAGIKHFTDSPSLSICEIGCGGGDNLAAIYNWCKKHTLTTSFTGIDIKKECIAAGREQYPNLPVEWVISDYADAEFKESPSVIFSSLFCHHFTNEELVKMLQWMHQQSSRGFFINDLHRHPVAYYSIKWLTRIFSRSYLVKYDAPLSVARSFKRKEWIALFKTAGIKNYSIKWKWAFRYLIVCKK